MALEFTLKYDTTKLLNQATLIDIYSRLRLLALSVFEWSGLPDTVSERHLEKTLYEEGKAFFFNDPKTGFLCLRGSFDGQLNVYGEPINVRVSGQNGYNEVLKPGKYVMIRNNYDMIPTYSTISMFAQRLARVERSIDVNVNAQKTPVLILCDEKQRHTLKNVYSQYIGDEPVIYADKSMNPDMIKSIDTKAEFVADRLQAYKQALWNECMTFLGINAPGGNYQKAERMVVPEVESNNQLIEVSGDVMLLTRQAAAKSISAIIGHTVTVDFRRGLLDRAAGPGDDPEADPDARKGGSDNG